ncbi:helix-turn-helix domain-containing protein [Burkholderia multivorans]|uniref:helix-turn-helix domain-containing protein n=1 Tax=Burkholderia multivorans TaxID=87883 RepID=UPI003709704A
MQTPPRCSDGAISSRLLSAAQQRAIVIEILSRHPAHTHELRANGISHPAGRVNELRRAGYAIQSARVSTVDSDGFTHRGVALYTLTKSTRPALYPGPALTVGAGYGNASAYATVPVATQ